MTRALWIEMLCVKLRAVFCLFKRSDLKSSSQTGRAALSPPARCFSADPRAPWWQYQTATEMCSHMVQALDLTETIQYICSWELCLRWCDEREGRNDEINTLSVDVTEVMNLHDNVWPSVVNCWKNINVYLSVCGLKQLEISLTPFCDVVWLNRISLQESLNVFLM